MIKISEVVRDIEKSQSAEYHRGKSWEHCYVFFRNYKKFRNDADLLDRSALHLGFFLASWGMLRGSSFLLQKDYKFYVPIVKTLIEPTYNGLWDFDFSKESKEQNIDNLFNLKKELEERIEENNKADGDDKKHQMDLIITKIIMATMGCAPSYDRYFKDGLRNKMGPEKMKKGKYGNFHKNSFKNLLDLSEGDEELRKIYKETCLIKGTIFKHPPMKLLDLYFWLSGQPQQLVSLGGGTEARRC